MLATCKLLDTIHLSMNILSILIDMFKMLARFYSLEADQNCYEEGLVMWMHATQKLKCPSSRNENGIIIGTIALWRQDIQEIV